MNYTVGYYKDLLATVAFMVVLGVILLRGQIPRNVMIVSLVACIGMDGLFSLNPSWHCSHVGSNTASWMLGAQVAAIALIGGYLLVG